MEFENLYLLGEELRGLVFPGSAVLLDEESWDKLRVRDERFRLSCIQLSDPYFAGTGFSILRAYTEPNAETFDLDVASNDRGHVTQVNVRDTGELIWRMTEEDFPGGEDRYLTVIPVEGLKWFYGPIVSEPVGQLLNGW